MKKFASTILIFVFAAILPGCAPVISESIRRQVDTGLQFKNVLSVPEGHLEKMVIWGGVVIRCPHQNEKTVLEVLHTATDRQGRPIEIDHSEGRFLALYRGILDAAVYTKDREVTIAGRLKGKKSVVYGEAEYTYPLVLIEEIYSWPNEGKAAYAPYPFLWPHYPWGWPHAYF